MLLELAEEVVDALVLGDEIGLSQHAVHREGPRSGPRHELQEVLRIQDADDVVDALPIDGDPRVTRSEDFGEDGVEVVAQLHADHVYPGHHDFADDLVREIDDALHQLALLAEILSAVLLVPLLEPQEVRGRERPFGGGIVRRGSPEEYADRDIEDDFQDPERQPEVPDRGGGMGVADTRRQQLSQEQHEEQEHEECGPARDRRRQGISAGRHDSAGSAGQEGRQPREPYHPQVDRRGLAPLRGISTCVGEPLGQRSPHRVRHGEEGEPGDEHPEAAHRRGSSPHRTMRSSTSRAISSESSQVS